MKNDLNIGGVQGCRTKSLNHSRVDTVDKVELGPIFKLINQTSHASRVGEGE